MCKLGKTNHLVYKTEILYGIPYIGLFMPILHKYQFHVHTIDIKTIWHIDMVYCNSVNFK